MFTSLDKVKMECPRGRENAKSGEQVRSTLRSDHIRSNPVAPTGAFTLRLAVRNVDSLLRDSCYCLDRCRRLSSTWVDLIATRRLEPKLYK